MWILVLMGCATEPAPMATEGTFDALTYNVAALPDGLSSAGKPAADRMPQIAALLEEFAIVGLQEDFVEEYHALVVATSHETEEWFDAVKEADPPPVMGSGLSVLARDVEVVDYFEQHYESCHGVLDAASDCLASKGFQVLRVRLGGEDLDIYNTHHEAGGSDEDNAVREAQVQEVLDSIAGRSEGRAVLFMGDTNLRWSDPEDVRGLEMYADIGLLDACDLTDCPETDHIDRFLVRDSDMLSITVTDWWRDERFVDADSDDLSDHPAIAGTFRWSVR